MGFNEKGEIIRGSGSQYVEGQARLREAEAQRQRHVEEQARRREAEARRQRHVEEQARHREAEARRQEAVGFERTVFDQLLFIADGTFTILAFIFAGSMAISFLVLMATLIGPLEEDLVVYIGLITIFISIGVFIVSASFFGSIICDPIEKFLGKFLGKRSFGVIFILVALWDTIFFALVFWFFFWVADEPFLAFFLTPIIAFFSYVRGSSLEG